jgi:hypothetical protein
MFLKHILEFLKLTLITVTTLLISFIIPFVIENFDRGVFEIEKFKYVASVGATNFVPLFLFVLLYHVLVLLTQRFVDVYSFITQSILGIGLAAIISIVMIISDLQVGPFDYREYMLFWVFTPLAITMYYLFHRRIRTENDFHTE